MLANRYNPICVDGVLGRGAALPFSPQTELDDLPACKTAERPVDHSKKDDVQPGLQTPVLQSEADSATQPADLLGTLVDTFDGGLSDGGLGELRVAHQIHGEHQKREPEPIIGARFGGDDLSQVAWHVLVGKGALCNGLRKNRVRGRDAGADDQRGEERNLRDGG